VVTKHFLEGKSDQVLVKICGITNVADAESAIEAGADALGFNFYAGGKRYIDLDQERSWIRQLPPATARIAVVVNIELAEAKRLLDDDLFDAIQLHGDESPSYCESLSKIGKPILKALRIRSRTDLERSRSYPVFGLLFDSFCESEFGGTGHSFDWTLLRGAEMDKPIILAGGLTPENVTEAVQIVHPYAVDVASGVELNARRKDQKKMKDFVTAAKQAGRYLL
jgi:phosphoribosylanthranilate isomerase